MHETLQLRSETARTGDARPEKRRVSPGALRPELVITGDDLGLRADWDAGIFEALQRGVLTSTSVVTNGPAYPAVARHLREAGFDCGVHLNLVHGAPLSPVADVPSLVDAQGRFLGSAGGFLLRYLRGRVRRSEVALEWERQLRRALDDGLRPTHLNAHYHLHALPGLFGLAVELARRLDIGWVRMPDEPPWHARGAGAQARAGALWLLARHNRTAHRADGIGLMPCRGIAANGALGLAAWHALFDRLSQEAVGLRRIEVMCHPGQVTEESAALLSREFAAELHVRAIPRSFRQLGPLPALP
jgi:predicted glycoside hydrolase/deacetylase ChbG (UPF0249 family)